MHFTDMREPMRHAILDGISRDGGESARVDGSSGTDTVPTDYSEANALNQGGLTPERVEVLGEPARHSLLDGLSIRTHSAPPEAKTSTDH